MHFYDKRDVTRFGEISPLWQKFEEFFSFGKNHLHTFNILLIWHFYAIWQIFIAKKPSLNPAKD